MSTQPVEPLDPAQASSARLDEIEVKIAYLDDLVDALNRTVFRQQQQIDQLGQALAALRARASVSSEPTRLNPRDEIPPHY